MAPTRDPKLLPSRSGFILTLKIVPTGLTYLCVDRGVGTPILFNNTTSSPQTFKGKRLRVNIGNAANARVFANSKKVPITRQAVTIGYEFTPTRSKPLPAGQRRPCA